MLTGLNQNGEWKGTRGFYFPLSQTINSTGGEAEPNLPYIIHTERGKPVVSLRKKVGRLQNQPMGLRV